MQRRIPVYFLPSVMVLVLLWLSPFVQRASGEKNYEFHYPKDWKIVSIEAHDLQEIWGHFVVHLKDEAGAFHALQYPKNKEEPVAHYRFLPR